MRRPPDGLAPVFALDRRLRTPLHRQIYEGYRDAILDGRLAADQRLPSTRTLASELGVSRMPVVLAFDQLVAEGYITSRVGAGSTVSAAFAPQTPIAASPPGRRRLPRPILPVEAEPWLAGLGAFRIAQPALDAFPTGVWTRLVAKHARLQSTRQMMYGDAMGLPALRAVLADYLRTVRSVRCTADQIMIVSGSQQALVVAARALLAPGDRVWMEEPGFVGARDALTLAAARLVHVPVDDEGLDVSAGIARAPSVRAVYVTPSHQYPLGTVMSAPRRLQLLEHARRAGAWVIEDDYDSEYRYGSEPIASLQGLDADRRVIYIGTFSKVLFPALRVGYLVIPHDLVDRFRRTRYALDNSPSPLYQSVLHELIRDGHFARHLRRTRAIYAERRRVLVDALTALGLRVTGDHAGMHVVVELSRTTDDRAIATEGARRGLWLMPLSSCYAGRPTRRGLLIGYGGTRDVADGARRLGELLQETRGRSTRSPLGPSWRSCKPS